MSKHEAGINTSVSHSDHTWHHVQTRPTLVVHMTPSTMWPIRAGITRMAIYLYWPRRSYQ